MESDDTSRLDELQADYSPDEHRPLGGYLALLAAYGLGTAALATIVWRKRPAPIRPGDLVLLTVATHRLSRTLAKDSVTSLLRAPLTRYQSPALPSEVDEEVQPQVHGHPVQHAVAELVSCPFCLAQWTATALVGAQALAPRATRAVTTVLTIVTGADALQFGYAALQRLQPS